MRLGYYLILGAASTLSLSTDATAKPSIITNAVPGVNFSAYKTYSWVESGIPAGMDPVMYQRIIADFDAALAQKGYQKCEAGDLSLVVTVGAQNKTDIETWGRFGLQTSVYQYTQGQLSLDVFDTKTKQALWHGQVSETVNPDKPNPSKVDAAISKLMQKFPVTAAAPATSGTEPPAQ